MSALNSEDVNARCAGVEARGFARAMEEFLPATLRAGHGVDDSSAATATLNVAVIEDAVPGILSTT